MSSNFQATHRLNTHDSPVYPLTQHGHTCWSICLSIGCHRNKRSLIAKRFLSDSSLSYSSVHSIRAVDQVNTPLALMLRLPQHQARSRWKLISNASDALNHAGACLGIINMDSTSSSAHTPPVPLPYPNGTAAEGESSPMDMVRKLTYPSERGPTEWVG